MSIERSKVHFTQKVIVKAPGLLPMKYKIGELAEKLQMEHRTLSDWTDVGAPHERDEQGRIWIIGTEFAKWVETVRMENKQRKDKNRVKLLDTQAFCLRCNEAVDLINPQEKPGKGKQFFIKGVCPKCGCTINRGGRKND